MKLHAQPKLHADVLDVVEKQHWSLFVGNTDILANHKIHATHDDRVVWESLTKLGNDWLRVRVMFKYGSSVGHFWVWQVAGDTGMKAPRFDRVRIIIASNKAPQVNYPIEIDRPLAEDPRDPRFTIGGILHGQGRAVRHFTVNFGDMSWGSTDGGVPLGTNDYCPKDPTQTGGLWAYMGLTYPVKKIHLGDIYMLGGYGGYFQNRDGSWLTEEERPQLQAGTVIHEHSADKGWITYSKKSTPWRDRLAVFSGNQDDQHMEQFCVLAQMALEHPEDEGLQMLMEAAVHVYTRAVPVKARGTTHQQSGAERAQGRIMMTGADLYQALMAQPNILAVIPGKRCMDRWMTDRAAFLERWEETGFGFKGFSGTGGFSANEIGIHFHGMWRLHELTERFEIPHFEDVHFWMHKASKWLFESFRYYDIPGDRKWSHPYYEGADHSNATTPVSSEHFAWLGATHYEPKNPTERDKMKHLLELGESIPERFKR